MGTLCDEDVPQICFQYLMQTGAPETASYKGTAPWRKKTLWDSSLKEQSPGEKPFLKEQCPGEYQ
jgi:hypothetical protein